MEEKITGGGSDVNYEVDFFENLNLDTKEQKEDETDEIIDLDNQEQDLLLSNETEPPLLTVISTLKLIAMTGGTTIIGRVISSGGVFLTNTMMAKTPINQQNQSDILAAGTLINTLQRFLLALPATYLSIFGNKMGEQFQSVAQNPAARQEVGRFYRQSQFLACFFWMPSFIFLSFSG